MLCPTFILLAALAAPGLPQASPPAATDEPPPDTVEKAFLLVGASKSWDEARSHASQAAQALAYELKVNVEPHATEGLTFPAAECEANGFGYPCYVARGRFDDGEYVSVEWSSAYPGFTPGLYIVVVASGPEAEVEKHLAEARAVYSDAYIKRAPVYVGCVH